MPNPTPSRGFVFTIHRIPARPSSDFRPSRGFEFTIHRLPARPSSDFRREDRRMRGVWRRIPRINTASPNSAAPDEDRRILDRSSDIGPIAIPRRNNASPNSAGEFTARGVNGVSKDVISALMNTRVYEAAAGDPEVCAVCQDNYRENQRVGVLRCRHEFHADCIGEWLQIKNVCPLCNAGWAV